MATTHRPTPATLAAELLERIDELNFSSDGTGAGRKALKVEPSRAAMPSTTVYPIDLAGQPLHIKLAEDLDSISIANEPGGRTCTQNGHLQRATARIRGICGTRRSLSPETSRGGAESANLVVWVRLSGARASGNVARKGQHCRA